MAYKSSTSRMSEKGLRHVYYGDVLRLFSKSGIQFDLQCKRTFYCMNKLLRPLRLEIISLKKGLVQQIMSKKIIVRV